MTAITRPKRLGNVLDDILFDGISTELVKPKLVEEANDDGYESQEESDDEEEQQQQHEDRENVDDVETGDEVKKKVTVKSEVCCPTPVNSPKPRPRIINRRKEPILRKAEGREERKHEPYRKPMFAVDDIPQNKKQQMIGMRFVVQCTRDEVDYLKKLYTGVIIDKSKPVSLVSSWKEVDTITLNMSPQFCGEARRIRLEMAIRDIDGVRVGFYCTRSRTVDWRAVESWLEFQLRGVKRFACGVFSLVREDIRKVNLEREKLLHKEKMLYNNKQQQQQRYQPFGPPSITRSRETTILTTGRGWYEHVREIYHRGLIPAPHKPDIQTEKDNLHRERSRSRSRSRSHSRSRSNSRSCSPSWMKTRASSRSQSRSPSPSHPVGVDDDNINEHTVEEEEEEERQNDIEDTLELNLEGIDFGNFEFVDDNEEDQVVEDIDLSGVDFGDINFGEEEVDATVTDVDEFIVDDIDLSNIDLNGIEFELTNE